mgnify:CR=1 FL=1
MSLDTEYAKASLKEMIRQTGNIQINKETGMIQKGVIVRHLVLPGHVKNSKAVIKYLLETYKDQILISIMNQYTPMPQVAEDPLLGRKVTKREYEKVYQTSETLCFWGFSLPLTLGEMSRYVVKLFWSKS